jgi:signal transduction histidine kinase
MRFFSGIRRLGLYLLPCLLLLPCLTCWPQTQKNVLLVYEDFSTLPAYYEMELAIFHRLRDQIGLGNVVLFKEEMDISQFPEEYSQRLAELRTRYAKRNIDAVIFVGSDPVEFLPGVPIVYVGNLPEEQARFGVYHERVGAVWYGVDPVKIVTAAHALQPQARKVVLISGSANSDRMYLDQFRNRLKSLEPAFNIETVGHDTVEQLLDRVSHFPQDTIVVMISYTRDSAGRSYVPLDIATKVARVSSAPVYGVTSTYVGTGIVGGYVIDWTKTGIAAADVAIKLMDGKIEIASPDSASAYMWDWRQLQRWGFSESDLPPGSEVRFRVPGAWELYRGRIIGAAALIVAQSLLIGGLLIQRLHRKRAEDSLRETAGKLLRTQDEERRRVARELHDGTGQHLSGIALGVGQVLADFPEGYEPLRRLLKDSYAASRQALEEVRAVSYALHPPLLDGIGLIPALQWYLDGLQKRTNFRIDFEASDNLADAPLETQRTLFRIVQESVTNALRHSEATVLKVKLVDSGKGVTLEVEDNGVGMSREELQRASDEASLGVGIAGMRERVQQLHGTFKINSNHAGTQVSVSLPTREEHYATHPAG